MTNISKIQIWVRILNNSFTSLNPQICELSEKFYLLVGLSAA